MKRSLLALLLARAVISATSVIDLSPTETAQLRALDAKRVLAEAAWKDAKKVYDDAAWKVLGSHAKMPIKNNGQMCDSSQHSVGASVAVGSWLGTTFGNACPPNIPYLDSDLKHIIVP